MPDAQRELIDDIWNEKAKIWTQGTSGIQTRPARTESHRSTACSTTTAN